MDSILFVCAFWLLTSAILFAQPMAEDFFSTVGGDSPAVRVLAVQADGSVVLGGWFKGVGPEPRMNLARVNPDGTPDSHFDSGANEIVNALAVQPDGKILVAGGFTELGGQARNRIARLNADGSEGNGDRYVKT